MVSKLKSDSLNSREWWKILKTFIYPSSNTSSLPPIFDSANDRFAVGYHEKANVLNSHICSQSMIYDSFISLPCDYPLYSGEFLTNIVITPEEVFDVLQILRIGKASGPDGISNNILVESALQISSPLCRLFNLCLDKCALPTAWKSFLVCPIFKSEDPAIPSNYNPISLLNSMEKGLVLCTYPVNFVHV